MEADVFFNERGYRLETEEADGYWWAHLIATGGDELVWSRYGRGGTEPEARERAMRRWITEQAT